MNRTETIAYSNVRGVAPSWGAGLARGGGEAAGGELNAVWVHGNAFQPEDLSVIASVQRTGWGTLFRGKPGAFTWFHLSIAAPVIIDGKRPNLERVFLLYKTNGASLRNVHVYDGAVKARAFDGLMLDGDLSTGLYPHNTWEINSPLALRFGLGLSIGVQFSVGLDSAIGREILFTTAGADFRTARILSGTTLPENLSPILRKL
jgi:hypothetical protein